MLKTMIKAETFETLTDHQLIRLLKDRLVKIKLCDCSIKQGVITNFIYAAQAGDPERTTIGFTLNGIEDISLSSKIISNIEVL